jgi:hypothetical protein
MIRAIHGERIDENKSCPNQTPEESTQAMGPALPREIVCDDFGSGRDTAISRLHNGALREHGFVSESAQADADSKKD